MVKPVTADDILPLVACMTSQERLRLLRLIGARPEAGQGDAYHALPPARDEFASDEEPLAWDAQGWEDIA